MSSEQTLEKLVKVIANAQAVAKTAHDGMYERFVDQRELTRWSFSLCALLESALGSAHHITVAAKELSRQPALEQHFHNLLGLAQAAETAWRNEHFFDIRKLARSDLESDLIGQADALLSCGYDRAAAVVAGAVLESHLRDIAPSWGVQITDAKGKPYTLGPLNIELKKAGAYDAIMQKKIDHIGGLRNEAAHGNPFNDRNNDVQKMINDVLDICDRVRGGAAR